MANILVFGDSIDYGFYDNEGGWVDRLKRYLFALSRDRNLEHDLKVYNLGISGDTTTEILDRFDCETKPRNWENQETIVVFSIGLNDSVIILEKNKMPMNQFITNIDLLLKKAKVYTNKIVFIGPTPVDELLVTPMPWSPTEFWFNREIRKYDRTLRKICRKSKVDYIELFNKFVKRKYKQLLEDGAHPNTKGHELIFKIVKKYLEEKKYV